MCQKCAKMGQKWKEKIEEVEKMGKIEKVENVEKEKIETNNKTRKIKKPTPCPGSPAPATGQCAKNGIFAKQKYHYLRLGCRDSEPAARSSWGVGGG